MTNSPYSDAEMIALMRGGERDQLEIFTWIDQKSPWRQMAARRLLDLGGKWEQVDELFNDALVELYKQVHKPDFALKQSSLSTYFIGIVRNCWLKKLRDAKKQLKYSDIENQPGMEDMPDSPDEDLEARLVEEELLWKSLLVLDEKCRQMIVLHHFERKKMKEVAAIFNYGNLQSAIQKVDRCRDYLRREIERLRKLNP